jgi:hypothetical protein
MTEFFLTADPTNLVKIGKGLLVLNTWIASSIEVMGSSSQRQWGIGGEQGQNKKQLILNVRCPSRARRHVRRSVSQNRIKAISSQLSALSDQRSKVS